MAAPDVLQRDHGVFMPSSLFDLPKGIITSLYPFLSDSIIYVCNVKMRFLASFLNIFIYVGVRVVLEFLALLEIFNFGVKLGYPNHFYSWVWCCFIILFLFLAGETVKSGGMIEKRIEFLENLNGKVINFLNFCVFLDCCYHNFAA